MLSCNVSLQWRKQEGLGRTVRTQRGGSSEQTLAGTPRGGTTGGTLSLENLEETGNGAGSKVRAD